MEVELYFDGCCEPNPGGVATYGFVVMAENRVLHLGHGFVIEGKQATNNVAEYAALIAGLEWLLRSRRKPQRVLVFGDSKLVIEQIRGSWQIRAQGLVPSYEKAQSLLHRLERKGISVLLDWISREKNKLADRQSKLAFQEKTGRTLGW